MDLELDEGYSIFTRYQSSSNEGHLLFVTEQGEHVLTEGFDGLEYLFVNVIFLEGRRCATPGESGSPILKKDEDGNWRIAGIVFGGKGHLHYAYPASMAEEMLDITFGVEPPVAIAVGADYVRPGEEFTLHGRYC